MRPTEEFVADFMGKLKAGKFKKDNLPNNGPKLTEGFVKEQNDSFLKLLQSDTDKSMIKRF